MGNVEYKLLYCDSCLPDPALLEREDGECCLCRNQGSMKVFHVSLPTQTERAVTIKFDPPLYEMREGSKPGEVVAVQAIPFYGDIDSLIKWLEEGEDDRDT